MNEQPLISVIVPCYNVEKYLNKCVDSILKQTYSNFELLLVDDGSLDKTSDICDYYGQVDNRVKVLHKANGGQSDARNSALDIMQGEYVTFVDSDDWIDEDYLDVLYNMMKKNECDISIASLREVYSSGKIIERYSKKEVNKVFSPYEAIENMFYQEMYDTWPCVKLYSKKVFANIRFPKGLFFEDLSCVYQLLLNATKIVYTSRAIYSYYIRTNSTEGSPFSEKKYYDTLTVYSQIINDDRLFIIRKAVECRMFSFLFRLYLSMPEQDERRNYLWKVLSMIRFNVLFNSKGRKKARVAAFLSYMGPKMMMSIYRRIKGR